MDPHDLLLTTLQGAIFLEELNIAWTALLTCLALAQKYFKKYDMEYKAIVSKELLLSPVSTVPGLYDGMPILCTNMEKLMFLHKENSHHSNSLLKGFHNTEFPWLIWENNWRECHQQGLAGKQAHSILGPTTLYKAAKEFFVPRSPISAYCMHTVPGYQAPNPLFGLASAGPYGFGGDSDRVVVIQLWGVKLELLNQFLMRIVMESETATGQINSLKSSNEFWWKELVLCGEGKMTREPVYIGAGDKTAGGNTD
ncbi:hypothetical protein C8J57DRAFT_1217167 [Mycena rebaudengoi]|nr:hypothetical protein C8J57DRAFT_1217167 [Mycena rebaudengoi]